MLAHQLSVKLYASDPAVDLAAFIPIFHGWIQERRMPDRLLIDVADYRHVPDGPGVVLVGHEAHYALESEHGPLGLAVSRKRDEPGELDVKLVEAAREALTAARFLEDAPTRPIRFRTDRLRVSIMSRRFAPPGPATAAAARPAFDALTARLFAGQDARLEIEADPRAPFAVTIEAPGAPGLAGLLERLGG